MRAQAPAPKMLHRGGASGGGAGTGGGGAGGGAAGAGSFKNKLCTQFQKTGACTFGDKCIYAHG